MDKLKGASMNPGPGFMEVLAFFTNAPGHPCQNAVGFEVSAGFDQTSADAVSDWLAPSYKAWLCNVGSRFNGVRVIVGNDGDPSEFNSASSAGNGTSAAAVLTPQVQGLIHKSTAFAGRKNRGRLYLPDVAENHVDDFGAISGTELTALQAIATQWFTLSAADALIGSPVVLHADGSAPTVITAMAAEPKVATQRRRYRR